MSSCTLEGFLGWPLQKSEYQGVTRPLIFVNGPLLADFNHWILTLVSEHLVMLLVMLDNLRDPLATMIECLQT